MKTSRLLTAVAVLAAADTAAHLRDRLAAGEKISGSPPAVL